MSQTGLLITAVITLAMNVLTGIASAQDGRKSPAVVAVEKVRSAVVVIQGARKGESSKEDGERRQSGAGIIVDREGIVVTDHRAIEGLETPEIVLSNGRTATK